MPAKNLKLNYSSTIKLKSDENSPHKTDFTPDSREGIAYVHDAELELAVEVALATGRPLLLRGKPGSGKSSFASYVARCLNWRYLEYVVTARSQARDLLWSFDTIRRLNDAVTQERSISDDYDYIEPGVLWWVLDRKSAIKRGAPDGKEPRTPATEPYGELNSNRDPDKAVLLIDEIDKADPDVPNNLLVVLGSWEFRIEETGTMIKKSGSSQKNKEENDKVNLLVIITTNEERELPQAFLRRCIIHELKHPSSERLVEIACSHFKAEGLNISGNDRELFKKIALKITELRETARKIDARPPSTGEYLDAIRACWKLRIQIGSDSWKIIEKLILRKRKDIEEDNE